MIKLFLPPIMLKISDSARSIRLKRYISKKNVSTISNFRHKFRVVDFDLFTTGDSVDLKWGWWSRIYEYEFVLNSLSRLSDGPDVRIHNTCWGWQGPHFLFKTELESRYRSVVNTDLRISNLANTDFYDITEKCKESWTGFFDFVVNVSTVEEVDDSHIQIIENLMDMVKIGGYLIATFDLPGLQINEVEKLFGSHLSLAANRVTGESSNFQMKEFGSLTSGHFILQRLS